MLVSVSAQLPVSQVAVEIYEIQKHNFHQVSGYMFQLGHRKVVISRPNESRVGGRRQEPTCISNATCR